MHVTNENVRILHSYKRKKMKISNHHKLLVPCIVKRILHSYKIKKMKISNHHKLLVPCKNRLQKRICLFIVLIRLDL